MFARSVSKRSFLHRVQRAAAMAMVTLAGSTAALASSDWSSVASTGAADEACAGKISLSGQEASLLSSDSAISSCTLRYQVVDTWSGNGIVYGVGLRARFLDNGLSSKVTAVLKAYNTSTGTITTVQTLNSDYYPASSTYQNSGTPPCLNLDFQTNSYWVEVVVSRTAATGAPRIAALRIEGCLI